LKIELIETTCVVLVVVSVTVTLVPSEFKVSASPGAVIVGSPGE
jgi:hypothetical protein